MSPAGFVGVSIINQSAHLAAAATSMPLAFRPRPFLTPLRAPLRTDGHVLTPGVAAG